MWGGGGWGALLAVFVEPCGDVERHSKCYMQMLGCFSASGAPCACVCVCMWLQAAP